MSRSRAYRSAAALSAVSAALFSAAFVLALFDGSYIRAAIWYVALVVMVVAAGYFWLESKS